MDTCNTKHHHYYYYYDYYYYFKQSALQGWKRVDAPYQSEDHNCTKPSKKIKEGKELENNERQKLRKLLRSKKMLLKLSSPTPSIMLSPRTFHRYAVRNKSYAELRGPATRRCIRIPMSDQGTTRNPYWHKGTGRAPQSRCIWLLPILYNIQKSAALRTNTPPPKKLAPQTRRSNILRCVYAPSRKQLNSTYFKTCRTKPRKHLTRSD